MPARADFRCESCAAVHERPLGGADGPCEDCGGEMRRLWSAPGVVLRGSGFYRTDSRGRS
jgi:predicted nucleic acid-binding Zn ribbon protein